MPSGISSLPPPRDSMLPEAPRTLGALLRDPRVRLLLAAAIIGACGALTASAFRWLVRYAWLVTAPRARGLHAESLLVVLAPALGIALAVYVVRRFAREPEGHGVSAIRASLITAGGFVSTRAAFTKLFACAVTTSSGGSAGCEGPVARAAASVGSWLAHLLRIDRSRLPTLTACGAAASISALFDAPISGVVFAVEVILGGYAIRSFAPLVVASASAAAVCRAVWGKTHAVNVPAFQAGPPADLLAYAGVGVCCGIGGAAFLRALDHAPRWAQRSSLRPSVRAALGGLSVGGLGAFLPGTLGVGYPILNDVFASRLSATMLGAILVARFAATTTTLASGGAGGVFSPSLVAGACAGALFSHALKALGLQLSASSSSFAVVGAVSMIAATIHAPFTAIVLVVELTDHYAALLPAAVACVLAALVSSMLNREPAYDADLSRRGIKPRTVRTAAVALRDRTIAPLVRSIRQTVPDTTPAAEVLVRRPFLREPVLIVVDSHDGSVLGVVDLSRLDGLDEDDLTGPMTRDVMTACPSVQHENTLAEAVGRLVRHKVPALPAVDRTGRPCGLLWREDLLEACARELAIEFALPTLSASQTPLVHSDVVAAFPVPSTLVARSLRDTDLRKRYGVVCLGLRRALEDGTFAPVPVEPSTVLGPFDLLIVSGPTGRIEELRALSEYRPAAH